MDRRTTGFPPTARDGSGRRRRQLGPSLTSGSGAPSYVAPVHPSWSVVHLPIGDAHPLAVEVGGVPQTAGADYVLVDRTLVFERPLTREPLLRFWARRLRHPNGAPRRRDDRVDVWLGSHAGVAAVRGLPVDLQP